MKNEVERLLKGRCLEVKSDKNLTENLREWREARNITKADYLTFVGNVLEELLEPLYTKQTVKRYKDEIFEIYFEHCSNKYLEMETLDAIQDIQVFCINETELMGYDNIKCNDEVFNEINSREQCPIQYQEWQVNGANGKWKKSERKEHKALWYKADYAKCKY